MPFPGNGLSSAVGPGSGWGWICHCLSNLGYCWEGSPSRVYWKHRRSLRTRRAYRSYRKSWFLLVPLVDGKSIFLGTVFLLMAPLPSWPTGINPQRPEGIRSVKTPKVNGVNDILLLWKFVMHSGRQWAALWAWKEINASPVQQRRWSWRPLS